MADNPSLIAALVGAGIISAPAVIPPTPTLQLSASTVLESASVGSTVGVLSVLNGSGTYTFTKIADPDSKFAASGANLNIAAALDYETKTSHSVTIQASNGTDTPIIRTFTVNVVNVLEDTLAPTTASFTAGATAGSVIATVTGFDVGAAEVIASISPNDGRLAFSNTQVLVGLSASTAGTINATVTTSAGRTLSLTVTVNAVVVPTLGALTISPSTATVGTAYTGSVSGRTSSSTLALSGAGSAGLSINSTTGAITGTPTTAGSVDIVETLAGATGSPRTSSGVITVSAAAPTVVALDPPITAAMSSLYIDHIGFDRMIETQTGNTVRLKELTGNTTQDFGFDSSGRFDIAAVNAWQPSADLDVVQFYGASGTVYPVSGTVAFRRSGVINRFGTSLDTATGRLSRTSNGGVGANLGGAGHISIQTALNMSTGFEIHMLMSPNVRKLATNDTTDTYGDGTSTTEFIAAYGNNLNAQFRFQMAGAAAAGSSQVRTSSTDFTTANFSPYNSSPARWKQYSQHIFSIIGSSTAVQVIGNGRRCYNTPLTTNMQTAVAGGTLNNGVLHIGANFASSSNNTASTTTRGNYTFGGMIITKPLTDVQRYLVQQKLNAIAQQHRVKASSTVMAYYDEWFFMKDVDASGNVAGRNGLCTLAFNKGGASTDWDFAYTIPNVGIVGIRAPTANANNKFAANNNFYAGVTTGSMLSLHYNEQTNNSLHYTFGRESQSYVAAGLTLRGNLALGFDHNAAGVITKWAWARDTAETLFTGRHRDDGTEWGVSKYETLGGGANQAMGKYNVNVAHNSFVYNETLTDTGWTWDKQSWLNQNPSQPYLLDAPVQAPVPENILSPVRNDALILQMANFEAPAGYDRTASYATRKAMRLQGKTTSYISTPTAPLGHFDGSYAYNPNAGVADGNDDDKLQSFSFQQGYHGTRVAIALKANGVLTQAQMEEVQVNMYKLVA